jgi:two-component system, LytTR family, response regulator
MKAILIDDEPYCLELLAHLLKKHCPEMEVIGQFSDALEAVAVLENAAPDVVFLDIEMPRLNGFDLLNRLFPFNFKLIFTTAYDKYAIRAIKFSALDYLLKPIDIEELKTAVRRAVRQPMPQPNQVQLAQQMHQNSDVLPKKIALGAQDGVDFVEIAQIIYCNSQGSYTEILLENGRKMLISKNLKELTEMLEGHAFYRIHHSHLVNLRHVRRFLRNGGGEVQMSDDQLLPLARSKKDEFLERMSGAKIENA